MSDKEEEKGKRKRKKENLSAKALKKQAKKAAELESLLFGKTTITDSDHEETDPNGAGEIQFVVDRSGGDSGDIFAAAKEERIKKPVWEDDEEAKAVININAVSRLRKLRKEQEEEKISGEAYVSRLRAQHQVLSKGTSWAELPSEKKAKKQELLGLGLGSDSDTEGAEGDGELLEDEPTTVTGGDLVVKSKTRLPHGLIEITRMRDGNSEEPSSAVIQSVQFHRNAQILLTAGFDKRLRLFQIDGKRNPKLQSIFLEDFPIHKASFVPDGSKVVCSSRKKHYMVYDLEGGRVQRMDPLLGRQERSLENFEVSQDSKQIAFLGEDGYIMLCSLLTKQWVANLKMNGSVRCVSFAEDGTKLISSGGDGQIYHWDLRTRRCYHRGTDEGCIKSTSLAVSSDSKLLAAGSGSGVVNLYNREAFIGGATRPEKSFMNLVTTIDSLKFNCDSQILAIASRMKKNALKLVHLPSHTVFSNWPTQKTPIQYVHSLDFSPGGGYMAVGNAAGNVLLYRLRHYDNA
ncbi:hypothetical protein R1sor_021981 [Riccia sorocarpa]|uniref:U3 small nucleolar RNA-associated protein 18 homolog n=1 Tax=Riccia sorocarpa TaxID=122646 RepID=A0ABD3GLQ1_9MARC